MTNYHVHLSCQGLGDSVCGLYAAAGIADSLPKGDTITLHTRHMDWLARSSAPGLILADHDSSPDTGFDMNQLYDLQLRESRSRKRWFSDAITSHYSLTKAEPRSPRVDKANASPPDDYLPQSYVVLAPFSAWESRSWPVMQYIKLASELTRMGWRVVVVDGSGEKLEQHFRNTSVQWFYGMKPEFIVDMLSNAALVIGNDSGIPHIAGLMGTPTIAVMAQLTPTLVFSHTDVQCVMPNCGCSPCAWQGYRGWIESCDRLGCAALNSISFTDVFQRAMSILRNQK
jgi:hypothetical protein